jgi:quercetin dioxygenase-like cupin family protein
MRTAPSNVRFLGYSGREMLAVRLSHFDPTRSLAGQICCAAQLSFFCKMW